MAGRAQHLSSSKEFQVGNLLVNSKYTVLQILHEGVNSKIYVGAFNKNNKQVTRIIKTVYHIYISATY